MHPLSGLRILYFALHGIEGVDGMRQEINSLICLSSRPSNREGFFMREHNFEQSKQVKNSIDPAAELAHMGIDADRESLFFSEPRQTSHLCERVIVNPDAAHGEIFRMEMYVNRWNSRRCFWVLYREGADGEGKPCIFNQFFTNDPEYAARKRWLSLTRPAVGAAQTCVQENIRALYE